MPVIPNLKSFIMFLFEGSAGASRAALTFERVVSYNAGITYVIFRTFELLEQMKVQRKNQNEEQKR